MLMDAPEGWGEGAEEEDPDAAQSQLIEESARRGALARLSMAAGGAAEAPLGSLSEASATAASHACCAMLELQGGAGAGGDGATSAAGAASAASAPPGKGKGKGGGDKAPRRSRIMAAASRRTSGGRASRGSKADKAKPGEVRI